MCQENKTNDNNLPQTQLTKNLAEGPNAKSIVEKKQVQQTKSATKLSTGNNNDLPQTQNAQVQQSLLLQMCKTVFWSRYLIGFGTFITLFIIIWRLSKASDGFASQEEETSFYRWMMGYFAIFIFQIMCFLDFNEKKSFKNFLLEQTISAILPLCLYV